MQSRRAHLATSPATNAGGWSPPEPPPCPGNVAAMISMTCSTAVFSMKEHSCASSSNRPAGGVDLPNAAVACWLACFALQTQGVHAELQTGVCWCHMMQVGFTLHMHRQAVPAGTLAQHATELLPWHGCFFACLQCPQTACTCS